MREVFFLLMAFGHDLATGFWLAVFGLYEFLSSRPAVFSEVGGFLSRLLLYALLLVFLTGIFRMWEYKNAEVSPVKRKFLLIKHLVLGPLLVGGTIWVYFAGP